MRRSHNTLRFHKNRKSVRVDFFHDLDTRNQDADANAANEDKKEDNMDYSYEEESLDGKDSLDMLDDKIVGLEDVRRIFNI